MKLLVFAHQLDVGGTPVNSIELAAALRDLHGYEVVFFATPGPMVRLVEEKCLNFVPAPVPHLHPSPARIRALVDVVRRERPDLVHVWDWFQCLDAYYSVHLMRQIPMLVTDMCMNVTRLLPKSLPTTFGTPELVDLARKRGRKRVELLLPPVDVHLNSPKAVDPGPFRERWGIEDGDILLVTVSRLVEWMKADSIWRTMDVIRTLGRDLPLRLVIVGDGSARSKLEQAAEGINTDLRRPAVVFTGALLDPRPAYAAADIVVGMGGAALRGMAFGKPVLIVGEQGFSAPLTPDTAQYFYYKGIYGRGGDGPGNARLTENIRSLVEHPNDLRALGQFSRQFVVQDFSLGIVSERLAAYCRNAVAQRPRLYHAFADGLRTAAVYFRERRFLIHADLPAPIPSAATGSHGKDAACVAHPPAPRRSSGTA